MPFRYKVVATSPGVLLSAIVASFSYAAEHAQFALLGGRWLEAIVLAILIGVAVRTALPISPVFKPGVRFSAKYLLEIAIVLLGASISLQTVTSAGFPLLVGIAAIVIVSILVTYLVGRTLGLSQKLSALIACGNSICGNSAIVAVAPVLRAKSEDVAASLAFTAVLGVLTVFALPLIHVYGGVGVEQYGIIAGMSVYAVPQVLAATAPVGNAAVQIGTIVKLVRVMMLGPVVFALGQVNRHHSGERSQGRHPILLPWFIIGFFLLMMIRSLGIIPDEYLPTLKTVSNILAVVAMGALGLMVDVRDVARAGGRVIAAGTISILLLVAMGYVLSMYFGGNS